MKSRNSLPAILLCGLLSMAALLTAPAAVVFDFSSDWKYFIGTSEASSPTTAWRATVFDDNAWLSDVGPIGYGEPDVINPLPTSAAGGYTTVFLRKAFTISNPAALSQLELILRVDDGIIAWINGVEIGRTNVAAGALAYNALASTAPSQWFTNRIVLSSTSVPTLASVLQSGTNVLAVHLFNGSSGSSDLYLDGLLISTEPDPNPPVIASVNPAAGSTVNGLTQITVNFSEPVTGIDAGDLRINNVPATNVVGSGSSFTFTFAQPTLGAVSITWTAGHGIADLGVPPNPFNAAAPGHTWSYTLSDTLPPTVVSIVPAIGATVATLTNITITFSEPVSGVNASDLRINGSPAPGVAVVSSSVYRFSFAQPPNGPVSVSWAAGHDITDLAAPANAFSGGSWSYTIDPNAMAGNLLITEFMASNTRTLADEDGAFEDWIEVHNPGPVLLDLAGWSLTDSPADLDKWTFPSTNLAVGGYLIVFASDKNRRVPGAPLHTNFRLSGAGEYLALVAPGGTNIASQFSPVFPQQVADVSYGLQQNAATVSLVNTTSAARVLVPANNALGLTWTEPGFTDQSWLAGTNGVGFETAPAEPGQSPYGPLIRTDIRTAMHGQNASAYVRLPFTLADPTGISSVTLDVRHDDGFVAYLNGAVIASRNAPISGLVADSIAEFSGTQGQNNWFYGHYNRSTDGNGTFETNDFIPFPNDGGAYSANNYWTGAAWDWFSSNPPWTFLDAQGGHPNGSNSGNIHWAMRRWQCEVNGTIRLSLRLAKSNISCGNGTAGRVFLNGTQVFARTNAFNDGAGVTTVVTLNNVQIGDVLDFAIDPTGTDAGTADGCDGTLFSVSIEYDAPELTYNSAATQVRPNAQGREFETISLGTAGQWLTAGDNVLAIHGLNAHATNTDFLLQATLSAIVPLPLTQGSPRYFSVPTPGGPNGAGIANLGPLILDASHSPAQPLDQQDLFVTARLSPALAPVVSNSLVYRVMFGAEVAVPMFDDGAHGDGAAGDGIFGGTIPASAATTNQMIRWYITARDSAGRTSRWPFYTDPNLTPQYLGTVVADPTLTNPLPVLHWFVQNTSGVNTDAGARGSLFFLGTFYDNIYMNLHGQSSRGFPKKSYDIEFNPGYKFTYRAGESPVSDVNMLTTYPDKAHMRNILAYDTFNALGNPYHWVEPVRVHQNGALFGTAHLVENGDDEFIERLGLNPNNPLYKMYNVFNSSPAHATIGSGNVEKKSRKFEGSADLQALLTGILQGGEPRRAFIYDNIDLPQMINSMVTRALVGEQDCCHKNYYFYRDTLGDGEWEIWPWDVDLSFGRRWIGGLTYWDDQMILDTRNPVGDNNALLAALYTTPEIREMYWRRFRTVIDEFLQPPGTPTNQLRIERRIDELATILAPDAAQDLAKWGTWCCGQQGPFSQATIPTPTNYQTLQQAANLMKFGYLPQRRTYLFSNQIVGAGGEIPASPQPANARVLIARFEASPSSGIADEEFLVLTNINSYAVDISGWKLTQGIEHTFKPGTVIPANRALYVSPNVNAFRARATSPRAGQSVFVQGNYSGRLSARGESVRLVNKTGRLIDSWSYPGTPSAAQQSLRITEIMYHPAPLSGNTNDADAFEFLELKNIGSTTLSLAGVRLDEGVAFNFTGSAVTSLGAGQSVLIVRDAVAFAARYPAVPPAVIAGQYSGSLNNGGERLRLLDAAGEEILDFEFSDGWHPITDGLGFSLVAVDEQAEPDAWNDRSQWRPSGSLDGTPGAANPPPAAIAPILITEVLSRSETPPPTDTVELHNPTGLPVDVGGWYLTDNLELPKKFRIPDNTVIDAGSYITFDETQLNAGGSGFAFSSSGEEAWLFSADPAGNLTGYVHGFDFGAADNNVSFGRLVTSDGSERFFAQSAFTPGTPNAGPRIGPVVITEIMYRPLDTIVIDGLQLPEAQDNNRDEFIEIQNITGSPVPLFDPARPTNTWRLSGGVDLDLPQGITLAAGEFALLVNFSPTDATALAAFRSKYNVSPATKIFGPYEGELNNNSDDVELKKPVLIAGATLAYVMVDKVDYRDEAPWPAGADGLGFSLQRWNPAAFGNDPINWIAASPTAASSTLTNAAPPVITSQPASQIVSSGGPATLQAVVTGAAPLAFQWMFNGAAISGATNSTLTISFTGLEHDGEYSLLAYNQTGLAVSEKAALSVQLPPAIQQQPQDVLVRVPPDTAAAPSTNATFTVSTFSRSAVTYQWRYNGTNLPGATNTSITFTNIGTNHLGFVNVLISDGVSTITSTNAGLYPLISPAFTFTPRPQDVAVNSPVQLSAAFSGWPPPFTVEWHLSASPRVTNVQNETVAFYNFIAPSTVATQQYRAVIKNLALPSGRASGFARVAVLADADGDGIPDAWETAYFNSATGANPLLDFDGDGMLNGEEYTAGTDPTNSLSYLKIDGITATNGARLQFGAISNKTYDLLFSPAPAGGAWQRLLAIPARSSNHVQTLHDPAPDNSRHYRVVTPSQP